MDSDVHVKPIIKTSKHQQQKAPDPVLAMEPSNTPGAMEGSQAEDGAVGPLPRGAATPADGPSVEARPGVQAETRKGESAAGARDGKNRAPDVKVSIPKVNKKRVSTYENQRHYFTGWSSKLLPTDRWNWSTEDGSKRAEKASFSVQKGWVWAGGWRIAATEGTDYEGWEYAIDFRTGWGTYGKTTFVRRRRWFRMMTRAPDPSAAAPAAAKAVAPHQARSNLRTIVFASGKLGVRFAEHYVVTRVAPKSQAQDQGVCVGWALTHVNGKRLPHGHQEYVQKLLQKLLPVSDVAITFDTRGAQKLTRSELETIDRFFKVLDEDGNERIDRKEALRRLHADAQEMFEDCDAEADGSVNRDQFRECFRRFKARLMASKDEQRGSVGSPMYTSLDKSGAAKDQNLSLEARIEKAIAHVEEAVRREYFKIERAMHPEVKPEDVLTDTSEDEGGQNKYWPRVEAVPGPEPYMSHE